MTATTDPMESLLSNFDQIYEDFKSSIAEIKLLRSNCNGEIKKREALEITCHSLKQDQLEYHSKCQIMKEEHKKVNNEHRTKEDELRRAIDSLKEDYSKKIKDLESQISGLLLEKATNEATLDHLRQDLVAHKTHMQTLATRLDQVHFDVESKYNLEIQDLKDCLLLEQEEKNELNKKLQDLEKELLISKTKLVEQQRDLTSIRNVETLKLKLMKLRKENEILKRKLLS